MTREGIGIHMAQMSVSRAGNTVLIVEDDQDHFTLIENSISSGDPDAEICTVHCADGQIAKEYLEQHAPQSQPRLVLLDLKLPRLNGHELLAWVKSHPDLQNIPVVILTTSVSEDDINRAYACHANSVLTKTLNFAEFRTMLTDAMRYWMRWNRG